MSRATAVLAGVSVAASVALSLGALPMRALAAEEVDLELVLAADGSGSIDNDELRLQREGWASALTSAEVLNGIRDGLTGRIVVAYVEWGGPDSQVTVVDWQVIKDAISAADFAEKLRTRPRGAYGYNSISNAIDYAVNRVETNAYQGIRKIIDVSGDGPNIGGRPLAAARGDALAKGFTINALAIRRPGGRPGGPGGMALETYYAEALIGGPGAFVEIADSQSPFALAAKRKLVQEIAGRPRETRHAQSDAPQ
ncbi:DUF1194 domain-containing protein [Chelatococcus asaccharovorans]|uniref:DUF1194 domain-containing protein n=1 Tax=Chelatococcus asaccharovorans TaxID=28210 RepID=UPI00224C73DD|nr:DUF1194 domain-containing protein [Chelatococcus asaccharovorans]CAH1670899.1 conserved exported hypothetical protein [Chelatococcus asaccharovorans]CAH1677651.1 conserved exported hypothetical protein [Chelatococcus asaccharovorans]